MNIQSNDDRRERTQNAYNAVTRFGICIICGKERPLTDDGTVIAHDRTVDDARRKCPGSDNAPQSAGGTQ